MYPSKTGLVLAKLKATAIVLCCTLAGGSLAQDSGLFPQPAEIQPAVDFWIKVYTEVDTQSGFLHDSQNLSVIYARLELNRQEIERVRAGIREDLRVLATGRRTGLTASQQEIMDL